MHKLKSSCKYNPSFKSIFNSYITILRRFIFGFFPVYSKTTTEIIFHEGKFPSRFGGREKENKGVRARCLYFVSKAENERAKNWNGHLERIKRLRTMTVNSKIENSPSFVKYI